MSQENVEIVRRLIRRFTEGDVAGSLQDVDPEAVLDWSNSDAPYSGIYTGHAGWLAFRQGQDEAFGRARRFDVEEVIIPAPDTVVMIGRMRMRGRASGIEVATRGAAVLTLRDRKVTRLKYYQTRDEALKALGLAD